MSSLSKYRLERTSIDENWNEFVAKSPNGTIFLTSDYLNNLDINFEAFYCLKSNELVGGFLAILDDKRDKIIGHDLVIYDGILYRDFSKLNNSQKLSEEFKVQQAVGEFVANNYSSAKITLHYSIKDVRPLLWVNYHSEGPNFHPDIRYTSLIDLDEFTDEAEIEKINLYQNASVARRQEIRYAKRDGVVTRLNNDVDKFIQMYQLTMERQEKESSQGYLNEMSILLTDLLNKELTFILEANIPESGNTGSMAVFLLDSDRAYYLFGANDPEFRDKHTGTAVLWDSFYYLNKQGCRLLDLEGVNSPLRGWFKTSFGGKLQSYFSMDLN